MNGDIRVTLGVAQRAFDAISLTQRQYACIMQYGLRQNVFHFHCMLPVSFLSHFGLFNSETSRSATVVDSGLIDFNSAVSPKLF